MAWVNETQSLIKIDDAKRRGFDVWECWLDNWGNVGAAADPNSLIFPTPADNPGVLLGGVYAAAIAPDSIVDRCLIQWSSGNPVTNSPQQDYYSATLSVGCPIRFSLPGGTEPDSGFATPANNVTIIGSINVTSLDPMKETSLNSVNYGDEYFPAGALAPSPWGPDGLFPDPTGIWTPVNLRVLLWVRPPIAGLPTTRTPIQAEQSVALDTTNPTLIKVVPVHGRKRVQVRCRNAGGSTITFQIGSVHGTRLQGSWETILATTAALGSGAGFDQTFSPADASFLTITATAALAGTTAQVTVSASDD